MICAFCERPLPPGRRDAKYCSRRCRQTAYRLRRRGAALPSLGRGASFAYADPPYPGTAKKYYRGESTYEGEVDHAALIDELELGGYAGWALSTSQKALRYVLSLCPPTARVCPWVKPGGVPPASYGLHNKWEPLIVVGGRQAKPGVADYLIAQPARFGGELPGRKPLEFCLFVFRCLGMRRGDRLDDKYPGTRIVTRAWHAYAG